MKRQMSYSAMSFEEQSRIRHKGDGIKNQVKDGMIVKVERPVLAVGTGEGHGTPSVYMTTYDTGIVSNKSAPSPVHDRTSQNPNLRRKTICEIEFVDAMTGETHRCLSYYDNVILPRNKCNPKHLKEIDRAKRKS